MDKYWKKNVLLNKTVANNLSLCVKNDGSNAKKGLSKSNVPTNHGFGANVLRFKGPALSPFLRKNGDSAGPLKRKTLHQNRGW